MAAPRYSKTKIPPKIQEFMKSEHIDIVDKMIDTGVSFREIKRYLDNKDYIISLKYISTYNKLRASRAVEKQNLESYMEKTTVAKVVNSSVSDPDKILTSEDKLKNDLDFLDMVIQTGTQNLREKLKNGDKDVISIKHVFNAIRLKDDITEGSLAGMTKYGIENLQKITEEKYMNIIRYMFDRYVPNDEKETAIKGVENIELNFYRHTDYYEEYLRAIGTSEKEIKRLVEYANEDLEEIRAEERRKAKLHSERIQRYKKKQDKDE